VASARDACAPRREALRSVTTMPARFDVFLFDAGGVFVLPDPTVLGPLLQFYGGDPSIDRHRRAHYLGMAAKSAAQSAETDWTAYNLAYVRAVGVRPAVEDEAALVLGRSRSAYLWRWPIPESVTALVKLHDVGAAIGVVSNASGQIEQMLRSAGVCHVGPGDHTPVRVIIDSHVVGIAKPDPQIFEHALEHFPGVDRSRVAYVGDSVIMDVVGARNAGLHPILLDPFDDHAGADFDRIADLGELLQWA